MEEVVGRSDPYRILCDARCKISIKNPFLKIHSHQRRFWREQTVTTKKITHDGEKTTKTTFDANLEYSVVGLTSSNKTYLLKLDQEE